MKITLARLAMLLTVIISLTAVSAFPRMTLPLRQLPGSQFPETEMLTATNWGGGCTNCICGLQAITCDSTCQMPLGTTIINNSDSSMLVKVNLAISFDDAFSPEGIDCVNTVDPQTVEYMIPAGSSVDIDFAQSFNGAFADAVLDVSATVLESGDSKMVGVTSVNSLLVDTTWPMCSPLNCGEKTPYVGGRR